MFPWLIPKREYTDCAAIAARLNEHGHKIDAVFRLLAQTTGKVDKIMPAIDDLKIVVEKYIADVTAAVAAFQADVQAKVDAAVAAALAGDNTAIAALSAEVAAADIALPIAPTSPPSA